MARFCVAAALALLLAVCGCSVSAQNTVNLGDLAGTGLPELAAAVVSEARGTPLEPIVNTVVRTVGDALGAGGPSLSAPSPKGASIFDTNAPPAGAPAHAPVKAAAPAPAPAAARVAGGTVPMSANSNDLAAGGRKLLRA